MSNRAKKTKKDIVSKGPMRPLEVPVTTRQATPLDLPARILRSVILRLASRLLELCINRMNSSSILRHFPSERRVHLVSIVCLRELAEYKANNEHFLARVYSFIII